MRTTKPHVILVCVGGRRGDQGAVVFGSRGNKGSSAVLKGNLLISGVKTNQDKTESLVHAAGNVYAEVEKTFLPILKIRNFARLRVKK